MQSSQLKVIKEYNTVYELKHLHKKQSDYFCGGVYKVRNFTKQRIVISL